jgi:predicted phosphodiesterase
MKKAQAIATFGICADIHKDIMPDADNRLQTFIEAATRRGVNRVIQLGDFCQPREENRGFMDIWNSFDGEGFHVLGNHDMDHTGGTRFSRERTVEFFGMPARYYSFDRDGIHYVILDGNDPHPKPWTGYNRCISDEQLEWLRDDLAKGTEPTVVFSHQGLNDAWGIVNAETVRSILEESGRMLACFCGHNHVDAATVNKGIHYVEVNSLSNFYAGPEYARRRFSQVVDDAHPWLKETIPFKDPVFAFVTINDDQSLTIEGTVSEFIAPTPVDLDFPQGIYTEYPTATIRDYHLPRCRPNSG